MTSVHKKNTELKNVISINIKNQGTLNDSATTISNNSRKSSEHQNVNYGNINISIPINEEFNNKQIVLIKNIIGTPYEWWEGTSDVF